MAGLTTLAALEGNWLLDRDILHDSGARQIFVGVARFSFSGGFLVQDEEGDLTGLPDLPPIKATRRYLWRSGEGRIEVLFDDLRPFHSFPADIERPEATHLCPPDTYRVAYDFSRGDRWRATWRVEGPRKSYTMASVFTAPGLADRRGETLARA